jgi:ATP-dependent DNA helicase RecG
MSYLQLKDKNHFRQKYLNPMIKQNLISLTIPNKPKSPNQKYIIV